MLASPKLVQQHFEASVGAHELLVAVVASLVRYTAPDLSESTVEVI